MSATTNTHTAPERPISDTPNTAPIRTEIARLTRRFLGDIHTRDRKEQKEFKTYVKGGSTFSYKGKSYPVRQEYFYIKN
jgi:hypothetical protein